jgi:hypothetical protein
MELELKINEVTLEPYFDNRFLMYGKYDLPLIEKQKIDLENLKLIRFSSVTPDDTDGLDATVHFFEFDNKFDEVWRDPEKYLKELSPYKQIISPNFSLYRNMSLALQIFNTFRNRWLGAYYQEKGLAVIPAINWSDNYSFDFCFDGVEEKSVVAVTTLGCAGVKWRYMTGFKEMLKKIKPERVICYGTPFGEMKELCDLTEVEYKRNERLAPLKNGGVL